MRTLRLHGGSIRALTALIFMNWTLSPQALATATPPTAYKMVVLAGDGTLPAFDNAVAGMIARMQSKGTTDAGGFVRLSASNTVVARDSALTATVAHVLESVTTIKPSEGQGCFVFATSHGSENQGLYLGSADQILTPGALDRALLDGCGSAPTVVIVSSCYSGIFSQPPMTRDNRIILTAARADRKSYGCQADRTYTVYDKCLLDAFDAGGTWQQAYGFIKECVKTEERREHVKASLPQAWFGSSVADLSIPSPVQPAVSPEVQN